MTETSTPGPVRTCVYCQASGPEAHFELIGPPEVRQNWACRQQNLCALRVYDGLPLLSAGGPVAAVLQLVRELAQVHRTDIAQQTGEGNPYIPGSPAWTGHARACQPMLSDQDTARLHLVLRAASDWLSGSGHADWGQQLAQARADLGCKQCGAMGPSEPCRTCKGGQLPRWHAGRKF